eukprot:TRINITY_DN18100_c0_g1_i1.p1 TRINITY_DN18100_c0_g1~~TRINITY_DN18100_c0_g1_i1.p1  ORF type:complete len:2370 (+),score=598.45 TRINITY_DN18100_c0_g1_i1:627-7736(+)
MCSSGACLAAAPRVRRCHPRSPLGAPCTEGHECVPPSGAHPAEPGLCLSGSCTDPTVADGAPCGSGRACRDGLPCIQGVCTTRPLGSPCSFLSLPNGGCAPPYRCVQVTDQVTLVQSTQCRPVLPLGSACTSDAECGVLMDRGCDLPPASDSGVCRQLMAAAVGAFTFNVRFCRAGLFLDTTGLRFFCARIAACTADSQCAVAGQVAYGYCACPEGAAIGFCRAAGAWHGAAPGRRDCAAAYVAQVAAGFAHLAPAASSGAANTSTSSGNSTAAAPAASGVITTAEARGVVADARRRLACCAAANPETQCAGGWLNNTALFGGDVVANTSEPGAVWCNERCLLTPDCSSWSYGVSGAAPRQCVMRRGRVWTVPSPGVVSATEPQQGCTAPDSAFDFTVPGMRELCPEEFAHPPPPRHLIVRPMERAQPHLPFELRVVEALVPPPLHPDVRWHCAELDLAALAEQEVIPLPPRGAVLYLPGRLLRGGAVYHFWVEVGGELSAVQPVRVNAAPRVTSATTPTDYLRAAGRPLTGPMGVSLCEAAAEDSEPGDYPLSFRLYCGGLLWAENAACNFSAFAPRDGELCTACIADVAGAEGCLDPAAPNGTLAAAGADPEETARRLASGVPPLLADGRELAAVAALGPLIRLAELWPAARSAAEDAALDCAEGITPTTAPPSGHPPAAAAPAVRHLLRALAALGRAAAAGSAARLLARVREDGGRLQPLDAQLALSVVAAAGATLAAVTDPGGLTAEIRATALYLSQPLEAPLVLSTPEVVLRLHRGPLGVVAPGSPGAPLAEVVLPLPAPPAGGEAGFVLPAEAVAEAAAAAGALWVSAEAAVDLLCAALRTDADPAAPWAAAALLWGAGASPGAPPLPLGAPAAFDSRGAGPLLSPPRYRFRLRLPLLTAPALDITAGELEPHWGGGELALVSVFPPGTPLRAGHGASARFVPPLSAVLDRLAEAAQVPRQRLMLVESMRRNNSATAVEMLWLLVYIRAAPPGGGAASWRAVELLAEAAKAAESWRLLGDLDYGTRTATATVLPAPTRTGAAGQEAAPGDSEAAEQGPEPPPRAVPALAAGVVSVRLDRRHGLSLAAAEALDDCKVWPREVMQRQLTCVWAAGDGDAWGENTSAVGCRSVPQDEARQREWGCECAHLPTAGSRLQFARAALPRPGAIQAFTDTREIEPHWLAPLIISVVAAGCVCLLVTSVLSEIRSTAEAREAESALEFRDALGRVVRLVGGAGALRVYLGGRLEGVCSAAEFERPLHRLLLPPLPLQLEPDLTERDEEDLADYEREARQQYWEAELAQLCKRCRVQTNIRLDAHGNLCDSPQVSPRGSPRGTPGTGFGEQREASWGSGQDDVPLDWRINQELIVLSRSPDAQVRRPRASAWWELLRVNHLWLAAVAPLGGLTQALHFRLHQRALCAACVVLLVLLGNTLPHTRCDDFDTIPGTFGKYLWVAAIVSAVITPGWYVFAVFFSQSPGELRAWQGGARSVPPVDRFEALVRPEPPENIDRQQELHRRKLLLQEDELDHIWQQEVECGRIHTAVSVMLLVQLRQSSEVAKTFEVDVTEAVEQARAWWCVKRVEGGGSDAFAQRYSDEESADIWSTALKALTMHDFQLAAALFHCALLSDNPDLYLVFNALPSDRGPGWSPAEREPGTTPPAACATPPPWPLRFALERMLKRNTMGRAWVEHYAREYLAMTPPDVYRGLLHSFVTADDVEALLGLNLPADLCQSWCDRAVRFAQGEFDSWQEGIRTLTESADSGGFPDLVESSLIFSWAPQELCSYLLHNTTALQGPSTDAMREVRAITDPNAEQTFSPKPLMYGRLMARYYCCVLSRLPGSRIASARLTPQEFADLVQGQERLSLTPEEATPWQLRKKGVWARRPRKLRYRTNVYLARLLSWKMSPQERVVPAFARSPLSKDALFDGAQLRPLTRLNSIWDVQGTGSRLCPFVGVEPAAGQLKQGEHLCLFGGRYPPSVLRGLQCPPVQPIVVFSDHELTGDRLMHPGARVRRSEQWDGPSIDGGPGGLGSVIAVGTAPATPGSVAVDWDTGETGVHCWGAEGRWELVVVPSVPVFGWDQRGVPPPAEVAVDPCLSVLNCAEIVIAQCHFRWGPHGIFAQNSRGVSLVRCSFEHLQLPAVHSPGDHHLRLFDGSNTVAASALRGGPLVAMRYGAFDYWGNFVGYLLAVLWCAFSLWQSYVALLDFTLRQACAWAALCAFSFAQDLGFNQPVRVLLAAGWRRLWRTQWLRRRRGISDALHARRVTRALRAQSMAARKSIAGLMRQRESLQESEPGTATAEHTDTTNPDAVAPLQPQAFDRAATPQQRPVFQGPADVPGFDPSEPSDSAALRTESMHTDSARVPAPPH